jgi:hypothetical protein
MIRFLEMRIEVPLMRDPILQDTAEALPARPGHLRARGGDMPTGDRVASQRDSRISWRGPLVRERGHRQHRVSLPGRDALRPRAPAGTSKHPG